MHGSVKDLCCDCRKNRAFYFVPHLAILKSGFEGNISCIIDTIVKFLTFIYVWLLNRRFYITMAIPILYLGDLPPKFKVTGGHLTKRQEKKITKKLPGGINDQGR
jgi:hypothetical protein